MDPSNGTVIKVAKHNGQQYGFIFNRSTTGIYITCELPDHASMAALNSEGEIVMLFGHADPEQLDYVAKELHELTELHTMRPGYVSKRQLLGIYTSIKDSIGLRKNEIETAVPGENELDKAWYKGADTAYTIALDIVYNEFKSFIER